MKWQATCVEIILVEGFLSPNYVNFRHMTQGYFGLLDFSHTVTGELIISELRRRHFHLMSVRLESSELNPCKRKFTKKEYEYLPPDINNNGNSENDSMPHHRPQAKEGH